MPNAGQILTGSKFDTTLEDGKTLDYKVSNNGTDVEVSVKKYATKYKNKTQTTLTNASLSVAVPTTEESNLNNKTTRKVYSNFNRALQYKVSERHDLVLYNNVIGYGNYNLNWNFWHYDRPYYGEAYSSLYGAAGASANRITFRDTLLNKYGDTTVTVTSISSNIIAREVKHTEVWEAVFMYGYEFDMNQLAKTDLSFNSTTKTFDDIDNNIRVFKLYDKVQIKVKDTSGQQWFFNTSYEISGATKGAKAIVTKFIVPVATAQFIKGLSDAKTLDYFSFISFIGTANAPDIDYDTLDIHSLDYQDVTDPDTLATFPAGSFNPIRRDPFYVAPSNGIIAVGGGLVNHHLAIRFNPEMFGCDLSSIYVRYRTKNSWSGLSSPAGTYTTSKFDETVASANSGNPDYDEDNYDQEFWVKMSGSSSSTAVMYTCDEIEIRYVDGDGNSELWDGIVPIKDLVSVPTKEFSIYKSSLESITPHTSPEIRELYRWKSNQIVEVMEPSHHSSYVPTAPPASVATPYTNDFTSQKKLGVQGSSNFWSSFKSEINSDNIEGSTYTFNSREIGTGTFQINSLHKTYNEKPSYRYDLTEPKIDNANTTAGITGFKKNISLSVYFGVSSFRRVRKVYGLNTITEVMDEGVKEELILPPNMRAVLNDEGQIILQKDLTSTDGKMHNPSQAFILHKPFAQLVHKKNLDEELTDINIEWINPPADSSTDEDFELGGDSFPLTYSLEEIYVDKDDKIHYIITKLFDNETKASILSLYDSTIDHILIDPLGEFNLDAAVYDTYIRSASPNSNYGNGGSLQYGVYSSTDIRRVCFKPNLTSLPAGVTIRDAVINLEPFLVSDYGYQQTAHGYQAVKIKNNWAAGLTWNKYKPPVWMSSWYDHENPGLLPHMVVNTEFPETDDVYNVKLISGYGWDGNGSWFACIPDGGETVSLPLTTAGIQWVQDIADNAGMGTTNSIILWDSKMEYFNDLSSGIKGLSYGYSEDSNSDNTITVSVMYDLVEWESASGFMVQPANPSDFDEWFLADSPNEGITWSIDTTWISYKVRNNGGGFNMSSDSVEYRLWDGSQWGGWSTSGLIGHFSGRSILSGEPTGTTDDWVYPIFEVDTTGWTSDIQKYKIQFRINWGGSQYSDGSPFLFINKDTISPGTPAISSYESNGGSSFGDNNWITSKSPYITMTATDADSGLHGYSMCIVPPGYTVGDYNPDSDTDNDSGGWFTTQNFVDISDPETGDLPIGEYGANP